MVQPFFHGLPRLVFLYTVGFPSAWAPAKPPAAVSRFGRGLGFGAVRGLRRSHPEGPFEGAGEPRPHGAVGTTCCMVL